MLASLFFFVKFISQLVGWLTITFFISNSICRSSTLPHRVHYFTTGTQFQI